MLTTNIKYINRVHLIQIGEALLHQLAIQHMVAIVLINMDQINLSIVMDNNLQLLHTQLAVSIRFIFSFFKEKFNCENTKLLKPLFHFKIWNNLHFSSLFYCCVHIFSLEKSGFEIFF